MARILLMNLASSASMCLDGLMVPLARRETDILAFGVRIRVLYYESYKNLDD